MNADRKNREFMIKFKSCHLDTLFTELRSFDDKEDEIRSHPDKNKPRNILCVNKKGFNAKISVLTKENLE